MQIQIKTWNMHTKLTGILEDNQQCQKPHFFWIHCCKTPMSCLEEIDSFVFAFVIFYCLWFLQFWINMQEKNYMDEWPFSRWVTLIRGVMKCDFIGEPWSADRLDYIEMLTSEEKGSNHRFWKGKAMAHGDMNLDGMQSQDAIAHEDFQNPLWK